MDRKNTRYLSHRVFLLSAAAGLLILFLLLFCLQMIIFEEGSLWPFFLGLAAFLGIIGAAFYYVVKPYLRFEKMMRLFTDGYTTMKISDLNDIAPTPGGYRLLERMDDMMDSSELLKLNKRQAQYLALQNQINPHFLYNTLESIRSEALIAGLNSVAEMTESLATFFRYTISKVENLVSVEEEIQNCETYFKIQQYRFGTRLSLSIEGDPDDRDEIYCCRLPKLTMQPILENSIIHGTECKIGSGHLTIRLERTGKRLLIRISDDGIGMDEASLARMNDWRRAAGLLPHRIRRRRGELPSSMSITESICCLARNTDFTYFPCREWVRMWKSHFLRLQATGISRIKRR